MTHTTPDLAHLLAALDDPSVTGADLAGLLLATAGALEEAGDPRAAGLRLVGPLERCLDTEGVEGWCAFGTPRVGSLSLHPALRPVPSSRRWLTRSAAFLALAAALAPV